MRTAVHLAAFDLRRVWPGLAVLLGLHVLRLVAVERAPLAPVADAARTTAFANGEGLALLLEVLATLVMVSVTVHRDPLVGRRAFWMTRPIPPRAMWLAKALVLSPLVIVPAALNAGRLLAYGADAPAVLASSLQLTVSRSAWIGMSWLVAAVTPSTAAFVLAGIGIWITFILYALAVLSLWPPVLNDPARIQLPPVPLRNDGLTWLTMAAACVASFSLLAWQYGARRRVHTAMLAAATLLLVMSAHSLAPVVLRNVREPEPPAWFASLRDRDITLVDHRLSGASFASITQLGGRLEVAGVPGGYSVLVIPRRTRLTGAGRTIEGHGQSRVNESPADRLDFVLATADTINGSRPATQVGPSRRIPNADLLVARAEIVEPFADRVVRVDADLEIRLTRHRLFAALPLHAGAAVRHQRALFEVTRVGRDGRDLVVRIRHAQFATFRPAPLPAVTMALHEPETRSWSATPYWPRSIGDQLPGFGCYIALPLTPYGAPWAGSWQSIHELRVTPPASGDVATWQRSVRLVLMESTYSGRISRQWSDSGVYLSRAFGK